MECRQESNKEMCTCSFHCSRMGICCECVKHHRDKGQIPGCFFSKEGEASADRSIEAFIADWNAR